MITHKRTETNPPTTQSDSKSIITITPMERSDAREVIQLMRSCPEVAFCQWEDEDLLCNAIAREDAVNLVAKRDGQVVGALIGGSFGVRGTISHLAIAEEYRHNGLARELVGRAFERFRSMGVWRVFLFVLNTNQYARRFWKYVGFHLTGGEATFERDL